MDNYYQVVLKTHDAAGLLKTSSHHQRNLFETASFKLALLYRVARRNNVYALLSMYNINSELDDLIAVLKRKIHQSKRATEKKLGYVLKVHVEGQINSQLRCNTILAVKLMLILKLFDDYVMALVHAKHAHVFEHQNDFYRIKNRMKERVCQLLSKIAAIRSQQYPPITLQHYWANDMSYQEALKIYGEINPQALQHALISPVTPDIVAQDLNQALAKLSELTL